MGGGIPTWTKLWQPMVVAVFYIAGQCAILAAVSLGDVSVATPIASAKVIIVSFLLVVFGSELPTSTTWAAAFLATAGVVLINYVVPSKDRKKVFTTVVLALVGAFLFACFDISIQTWAPGWGTGRFVPVSYWFVGFFSLVLLPWVDSPKRLLRDGRAWKSLLIGSVLVAVQAMFLVYAISQHGDAARINVIYSLRGLWGVLFAWMLSGWFGGGERSTASKIMLARMGGALLLVLAVVLTVMETQNL